MAYSKFHDPWVNFPSESTPITAAALNHIEAGIADAMQAPASPSVGNALVWNGSAWVAENRMKTVRRNSSGDGFARSRLNVIEGAGISLNLADDAGSDEVDLTVAVPAEFASLFQSTDILVNGSMGIWQRGNGPFTADGYCADCWNIIKGAGSTISVTHASAPNTVGPHSTRSMEVTYTHGSAETRIANKMPFVDAVPLRGKINTFRMHVKSSVASAVRLGITDGISTEYSPYHSGGGAWEPLLVALDPADASTELTVFLSLNAGSGAVYYFDNGDLIHGEMAATATIPGEFSRDSHIERHRAGRRYQHIAVSARFPSGGGGEIMTFPVYFATEPQGTPTITLFTTGTRTGLSDVTYFVANQWGARVRLTASGAGEASVTNDIIAVEWNP